MGDYALAREHFQHKRRRGVDSPLDRAHPVEVEWQQVAPIFGAAGDGSYVYFIGEEDGPVKIGFAKDPLMRMRTMQTGNPRRLKLEYALVGTMAAERKLHETWEAFAIYSPTSRHVPGTEWFDEEIRAPLWPIVASAADEQVRRLAQGGLGLRELERIIWEAHVVHDFEKLKLSFA